MVHSLLFSVWMFVLWKVCGMPSPGFAGRLLPAAWLFTALLSGRSSAGRWFMPFAALFTVAAWFWMIWTPGWYMAAAVAVAGMITAGITNSRQTGSVIRGILPVLLVSVLIADVNSDEVRFAEIACETTGIQSDAFGESHLRAGDLSSETGHHTPVYPVLISPGLMAGDQGLRIIPVAITLGSAVLLSGFAGPVAALVSALLYPGFSTLGLAFTGWLAMGLFLLTISVKKKNTALLLRLAVVILLVSLKMRYAGLAFGIILAEYASLTPRKGKWLFPAIFVLSVISLLALDRYVLGGGLFWARYGNVEALKLIWINVFHRPMETLNNLGWSLFDPEAGLFFRAPWTIAALFGLPAVREKSPALFSRLIIPSVFYWLTLVVWLGSGWHGLPAPAGRMFLPLVPMFAAGLREVWNKRETRLLIAVSIAISGIAAVFPQARANFADGTDTILSLLGSQSGFSMVRSNPLNLFLPVLAVIAMLAAMKRKGNSTGIAAMVIFTISFLTGIPGKLQEAEDLGGDTIQCALLYPRDPDPVIRYFWFTGKEILVEFSRPEHSILLRGAAEADTLFIEASSSGGTLMAGETCIHVSTPLIELPEEYQFMGRREEELPDLPQNREHLMYRIPVSTSEDTLRITFGGGEPVYIDRAGLL